MIDCKTISNKIKQDLKKEIKKLNTMPYVVILTSQNKTNQAYINGRIRDFKEVGVGYTIYEIDENASYEDLLHNIKYFNNNNLITSIMIDLPLHLSEKEQNQLFKAISPKKDIDNLGKSNYYTQATPLGAMMLLKEMEVNLQGKIVTILGRSENVGKPLVNMLIDKGATVVSCNSHTNTEIMQKFTLSSDIIISAVGKRNLIFQDLIYEDVRIDWFNEKTKMNFNRRIIIDIGINFDGNGKICGDCDKELYDSIDLITPVPNGMGLMTRCALIKNIIESCRVK